MPQIAREIGYGVRVLRRSPVIAMAAIVSIALGIGANTAIFSLLNALSFRKLPIPRADQLMALTTTISDDQNGEEGLTLPMFDEIARYGHFFSSIFAVASAPRSNFEVRGVHFAATLDRVSGDYFAGLQIRPLLGRLVSPPDVSLNAGTSSAVAVISYQCWQQRYLGDPRVVGTTIHIEGLPFTVIGVEPKTFRGLNIDAGADVTVPLAAPGTDMYRAANLVWLRVFARLKDDVNPMGARSAMTLLWPRIQHATMPAGYESARKSRFMARHIKMEAAGNGTSALRKRFSRPLIVLLGLVGAVLLIACVNLANLMLAHAIARQQEIAIRSALGAGTGRLIRQWLVEAILLSTCGGVLGLGVAFFLSRLLVETISAGSVQSALDISPDWRVLAFTASATILTGLFSGIAPAVRIARVDSAVALRENSRSVQGGGRLASRVLVTAQLALSLLLVASALLFVRTLRELHAVQPGFTRDNLLIFSMLPEIRLNKTIANRTAYYHDLARKTAALPGVMGVTYSDSAPGSATEFKRPVFEPSKPEESLQAIHEVVGPDFFHVMSVRLLAGREFNWRDDEHHPGVAVISKGLADRLFPRGNSVSRTIALGSRGTYDKFLIIGVVDNARLWKPDSPSPYALYLPLMQQEGFGWDEPLLDIRGGTDPARLRTAVTRMIRSQGVHYVYRTQTFEERADAVLTEQRLTAILSSFFGAVALVLAAIGVYGLVSYTAARRTAEVGLRMALGAQRAQVMWLIFREAFLLMLSGIAVGIVGTLAGAHLIRGLLFGVSSTSPSTIAAAVAILSAMSLAASYFPARRAAQVDPVTALRNA